MKTLRFVIMALTFGMLGVAVSSCDKEDKASIPFSGEMQLERWDHQADPFNSITYFDNYTYTVQILSSNNHTFYIDLYSRVYAKSQTHFNGEMNITYRITGVVYDENGNEVNREFVNPKCSISGSSEYTGTNLIRISADAGETIRFGVSVSCEGTVTKRFVFVENYVDISFSETSQSGTMEFEGQVR